MKRAVLAVFLCGILVSCAGGSNSDGTSTGGPSAPSSPTVPTEPGQPSTADWTQLAAQIAKAGAEQVVAALAAPSGSSVSTVRPLILPRPPANVSQTAGYFCCGPVNATSSHITVTTSITITPGSGALGILQTLGSFTETQWSSTTATQGWRIDLSQLRITGDLRANATTVDAAQQFRLQGRMAYGLPGTLMQLVDVDVLFSYANLESSAPTATGTMGSTTLTGQAMTPTTTPSRCSRPREGCGSMVEGNAPCTTWPACPAS